MNTPAHAVLNLLILGRGREPRLALPIAIGALLPDVPMLVFYAVHRGVLQTPERIIWSRAYFDPSWQLLFDLFCSLPLIAVALLIAWRLQSRWSLVLLLSMALHSLCDLALHHDDAHRHLLPLSDWRFRSPVSYWDPRHHGGLWAPVEATMVIAGSALLLLRYRAPAVRALLVVVVGVYALYIGYALSVWAS